MKKVLAAILTSALSLTVLAGCGQTPASTKEKVTDAPKTENKSTFTVGFDQDFPPYGFKGEDGEFTGFDLELAAEVARRMDKEIRYQPVDWDAKDFELESGTIDCIWNGFTMTGREDGYTWSEPYMNNTQVFVVRTADNINSASDLADKIITVQADSSAQAALEDEENADLKNSFKDIVVCSQYNAAFMDLESGAVDAIAMDVGVARYQIKGREDKFKLLDEEIASEQYGIGFKKGNTELRDKVQSTLEEMAADGTVAEISNKWFNEDVSIIGK